MAEKHYDGAGCILNLNRAGLDELSRVPEIGGLARRIVAYRNEHGPFKSLDDLDRIPGVDESLKESLRSRFIRFD